MKNLIEVTLILSAVVISVSFIGLEQSENNPELIQKRNEAREIVKDIVDKDDTLSFISTQSFNEEAEVSPLTKEVSELVLGNQCGKLSRAMSYSDSSPEVITDYKVGLQNCVNEIADQFRDNESENVMADFNNMMAEYQAQMQKLDFPDDNIYREDFELIFYRYAHLIKDSQDTPVESLTYFVLGDSAMRAGSQNLYMVGPWLMSKVIYKFQDKDPVAKYAWMRLESDIHFGYTGSSGDNTPRSWEIILKDMSYIVSGQA